MLTDITLGQYFPGKSFLHNLDPRTKVCSLILVISVIFLANTWQAYSFVAATVIFLIAVSRVPIRLFIKSLKPLWVILLLTVILQAFMTPGVIIWQWKFLTVTDEGFQMGIMMALRLIFLLLFSSVLTFTTSPLVLTDGLERLFSPGKKIGLPAHELAMMMTIALRFIPTLIEEADKIMKAQIARGADFNTGNIIKRAKAMIPILVPLFISSFRRADELAIAMEARCYRGGDNRTRMKELCLTWRDAVCVFAVVIFMVVLVWLKYR